MKTLLNVLEVNVKHKSLFRIGKSVPNKNRLIKVIMNCEEHKEMMMTNLKKLKNAEERFKAISVTDDRTLEEREVIKEWLEKVKKANEEEGENSQYIYKIRGSPKNDIRLVKFTK